MIKIYHNPRCTKSRQALQLLEEKGVEHEVVKYMDEPLTPNEMKTVLRHLSMPAAELIRRNEQIWKDEFKDKEMEEEELILAMIEYPKLMERPIVDNGDRAVVGRPTEKVLEVL